MMTTAAIVAIADCIIANKEFLTSLDAAIGDADHGINMARGFESVRTKLQATEEEDIGKVLKLVGMTLISTVGGASGPLYGTAFLRAATVCQGKLAIDREGAIAVGQAIIDGIKERGKAKVGEKTMLDALEPAYQQFAEHARAGETLSACLDFACQAARDGVEATKTIIATKGRASYLGERSLGHADPGATSSLLMLSTLAEFFRTQGLEETKAW